jgi:DNA-binding transcriptional ArsR family regulator
MPTDALKDNRRTYHFWTDDALIDTYGPRIGAYGIAVYALLARHATKSQSFPSYKHMMFHLKISRQTITRTLEKLSKEGLISKEKRRSHYGDSLTNLYTLHHIDHDCSSVQGTSPEDVPPSPEDVPPSPEDVPFLRIPIEGDSQKERLLPPLSPQGESAGFREFYDRYPKKEAREKAWQVWKKLKLDPYQAVIVQSVDDHMARDCKWQDRQYIPMPATFLNGRRWEDDLTPVTVPLAQLSKAGMTTARGSLQVMADLAREKEERDHGRSRPTGVLSNTRHDE